MAHFAKLDENNLVLAVHCLVNDVIIIDGKESEQQGIDFLSNLHQHNLWKQTSYNGNFRKNFAGIGYTFDEARDAFIPPKVNCHLEEKLNESTCRWECDNAEHAKTLQGGSNA